MDYEPTSCAMCWQRCDEPIVLWDGKKYCRSCLRLTYPTLYSFYEGLVDKSLPLRNSYGPAYIPHVISGRVWIRNAMFVLLITMLCLPGLHDGVEETFWTFLFVSVIVACIVTMLTILYISYDANRIARYYYPIAPQSCYPYPWVMIRNGETEIVFYDWDLVPRFTFAPFPFRLTFKLSDVAFMYGDSNNDPFYSADPKRDRKEVLLLDFSKGLENIWHPMYKLFGHEYNAWLKSPYIVCCTDTIDKIISPTKTRRFCRAK